MNSKFGSKYGYVMVALVAIAIGFFSAKAWRTHSSPPVATEQAREPVRTLPEFSLQNRAGAAQSIHSWPGKSLIINFWATWCAPCRREIPLLMELQQQYAAQGFQLVGIAVDFRSDVLKYADTMNINYPLLIGEQDGLNAVDAFGIEAVGFPYTIFTDAKGNIIATHIGELRRKQADLILTTIQKVNQGELAVGAASSQITAALSQLAAVVANEAQP